MTVSRRDFLRLKRTEQGRTLELSCQMLFMRLADAGIAPVSQDEYDQSIGEPPARLNRRTSDDIFDGLETDLKDVQVLRLLEPEWLDNMPGAARLTEIVDAFRTRGGRVE
jgi:hypothetical protein